MILHRHLITINFYKSRVQISYLTHIYFCKNINIFVKNHIYKDNVGVEMTGTVNGKEILLRITLTTERRK